MLKLDQADWRILTELQANGRMSNVDLAARVGLSESPCLRRVRRLEEAGIIAGYGAHIDHRKVGLDITGYIQVNLDQRSEAKTAAFLDAVAEEAAIIECYAVTGSYDYLLKVVAANLDTFAELTMQRILRFPGVSGVTSGLVLKAIKDSATTLPVRAGANSWA